MNLSDSVLIESKSARDEGLSVIDAKGLQEKLLAKVRPVFFSLWCGVSYLTTRQVSEFYGVPDNTIRQDYGRCKAEFDADGVIKLAGRQLQEVRDIMSLSSFTPQVTLYPPRAVIRMGFILKESEVAVQVRTSALNVLQGVGELVSSKEVLCNLIAGNPPYGAIIDSSELKVSAPLSCYYDAIARKLKGLYPDGGIPGLTKANIRERVSALSTYTQSWKLNTQRELRFNLRSERAKYPDLISDLIPVCVDGDSRSAIFAFQIEDLLIEPDHIEACLGRQYLRRAKQNFGADYAYLFLVAPFGATPDAEYYIKNELPENLKGFVGVITVKELAEFLRDQAWRERKAGLVKGEINTQFEQLLKYSIPESPLSVLMGLTF